MIIRRALLNHILRHRTLLQRVRGHYQPTSQDRRSFIAAALAAADWYAPEMADDSAHIQAEAFVQDVWPTHTDVIPAASTSISHQAPVARAVEPAVRMLTPPPDNARPATQPSVEQQLDAPHPPTFEEMRDILLQLRANKALENNAFAPPPAGEAPATALPAKPRQSMGRRLVHLPGFNPTTDAARTRVENLEPSFADSNSDQTAPLIDELRDELVPGNEVVDKLEEKLVVEEIPLEVAADLDLPLHDIAQVALSDQPVSAGDEVPGAAIFPKPQSTLHVAPTDVVQEVQTVSEPGQNVFALDQAEAGAIPFVQPQSHEGQTSTDDAQVEVRGYGQSPRAPHPQPLLHKWGGEPEQPDGTPRQSDGAVPPRPWWERGLGSEGESSSLDDAHALEIQGAQPAAVLEPSEPVSLSAESTPLHVPSEAESPQERVDDHDEPVIPPSTEAMQAASTALWPRATAISETVEQPEVYQTMREQEVDESALEETIASESQRAAQRDEAGQAVSITEGAFTDASMIALSQTNAIRTESTQPQTESRSLLMQAAVDRGGVFSETLPQSISATIGDMPQATPLRDTTRRFLQPLVGIDPISARVYRGTLANRIVQAYRADAVTIGDTIYLAADQRDESPETLGVLAHELLHVVRQRAPHFVPPVIAATVPAIIDEEGIAQMSETAVIHAARLRDAQSWQVQADDTFSPEATHISSDAQLIPIPGEVSMTRVTPPLVPQPFASETPVSGHRWGNLPAPWEAMPTQPSAPHVQAVQSAPTAPQTTPANTSSTAPVVQRAEIGRSLPALPTITPPKPSHSTPTVEPDLDALAQEVYTILKRRLGVEQRRASRELLP